uniref:Transmembrane protein n=1 Tax=Pithovirus LCPAC201 TaxID=2506591 RepID=A0A481Z511_9VIRU|nr:MAG: hypothetical protein LCPAC201_01780 [Pithovirus LCPAC201]
MATPIDVPMVYSPYKPSLREITRSGWSTSAPSSIIYHPSMKSSSEVHISGILVAFLIISIAILIGLIIWVIHLVLTNSKNSGKIDYHHK